MSKTDQSILAPTLFDLVWDFARCITSHELSDARPHIELDFLIFSKYFVYLDIYLLEIFCFCFSLATLFTLSFKALQDSPKMVSRLFATRNQTIVYCVFLES